MGAGRCASEGYMGMLDAVEKCEIAAHRKSRFIRMEFTLLSTIFYMYLTLFRKRKARTDIQMQLKNMCEQFILHLNFILIHMELIAAPLVHPTHNII